MPALSDLDLEDVLGRGKLGEILLASVFGRAGGRGARAAFHQRDRQGDLFGFLLRAEGDALVDFFYGTGAHFLQRKVDGGEAGMVGGRPTVRHCIP